MDAKTRSIRPVSPDVWAAWLRRKADQQKPVELSPTAAAELADLIDAPSRA